MLSKLIIKDIVLIKNLNLNFYEGFTVLTGETGTGKSILIDSLGLILGNRANFNLIRKGQIKGSITAIFQNFKDKTIISYLNEINIDINDEFIIRREIHSNGKSFSYLNDTPISINSLKKIISHFIEIQGQFDNHTLLIEKNHIDLLDKYCVNNKLKEKVLNSWEIYKSNKNKLSDLISLNEKNKNDSDYLEFSLNEFYEIKPQGNEENDLIIKRKALINRDKFVQTFNEAKNLIDGENGLNTVIKNLIRLFSKLESYNNQSIDQISKLLNENYITLEELSLLITKSEFLYENKDDALDVIDDRLYKLRNLSKKHSCQIDSLPQKKIEIEQKLNSIKNFSLELDNQRKLTNEAYNEYLELAKKLSINRIEVSQKLINEVNNELPALKLENAKFSIIINPLQDTLFSSKGIDDVKFYAQTNKDTKLGKISEIASGGELSRFLLIMKLVIEKDNTIKTLIFDEVDSGVGGATASAIGTKLLKIGNNQQTIVVTHSPQVAAKGNHHILIKKSIIENETITETFELNHQEKIEEIARMISDDNISNEARNAALKLLT
jgi:DNA repair protein RecN (Recombination protein N)